MNILLDLDGPLANFHKGYLTAIGKEQLYESWPSPQYDISQVLGITKAEFWSYVKPCLFENLEPTEDCDKIIKIVSQFDPHFEICTSPGPHPYAPSEKVKWVIKHLGSHMIDRITITHNKWHLARYDTVLVDDYPKQVEDFRKAGGQAILLPRPWNPHYPHSHCASASLAFQLEYMSRCKLTPNIATPPDNLKITYLSGSVTGEGKIPGVTVTPPNNDYVHPLPDTRTAPIVPPEQLEFGGQRRQS